MSVMAILMQNNCMHLFFPRRVTSGVSETNRPLSKEGIVLPGSGTHLCCVWVAPSPNETVISQGLIPHSNAGDHRLVQL